MPLGDVQLLKRIGQSQKPRHQVERTEMNGPDVSKMGPQFRSDSEIEQRPQEAGDDDGNNVNRCQGEVNRAHRNARPGLGSEVLIVVRSGSLWGARISFGTLV